MYLFKPIILVGTKKDKIITQKCNVKIKPACCSATLKSDNGDEYFNIGKIKIKTCFLEKKFKSDLIDDDEYLSTETKFKSDLIDGDDFLNTEPSVVAPLATAEEDLEIPIGHDECLKFKKFIDSKVYIECSGNLNDAITLINKSIEIAFITKKNFNYKF